MLFPQPLCSYQHLHCPPGCTLRDLCLPRSSRGAPTSVPGACPDPVGALRFSLQLFHYQAIADSLFLLPLFLPARPFVFNLLHTLLPKTGGWGWLRTAPALLTIHCSLPIFWFIRRPAWWKQVRGC